MIRINKNESPLKPLSQDVIASIISESAFNFYPDAEYERFKEAYAKFYGFETQQIIAGNGSDELIQKLMLIMPQGPVLTLNPDFFMYQAYAAQVQRPIHFVDAAEDLTFSLNKILAAIDKYQPSFFIMSNPHNPSGKQYDVSFLSSIADKMNSINGYFIIDEAYLDFGEAYNFTQADHILHMRTLSKAFAIAGLRLGVLIGTPTTINKIKQIEHPYPLNTITLNIAIYMFEHEQSTRQFIEHQRHLAQRLKDIFNDNVADLIHIFPSTANFVLTKGDLAHQLGRYIADRGFQPRIYNEPEMSEYVRYSIATDEQLDELTQIVQNWRKHYEISKNT